MVVKGLNIPILIPVKKERERAVLFKKILDKHGTRKRAIKFDLYRYAHGHWLNQCFDTAIEMAMAYDLKYVEGLLILELEGGGFVELPQGWCETWDGEIQDPTCYKIQGHSSVSYYGVAIKLSYCQWWHKTVGYFGCLDGDVNGGEIGIHYDNPAVWKQTKTIQAHLEQSYEIKDK